MKRICKGLIKIVAGLVVLILILEFSDYIHNAVFSHIVNTLYKHIGYIATIICILEVLISCDNIIDIKLKEKMKKRYDLVVQNVRERFVRSITNTPEQLPCSTLGQLLVSFYDDEEIFELVICELKRRYKINNELKSIISYIFLENKQDDVFAQFLSYNPSEKKEFEDISYRISTDFVDELYNSNEPVTNKYNMNDILVSLRHICLPQNHIEKNRLVLVCRTLLDMIREELQKQDFEEDGKNISLFLICLPKLQKKITLAKIYNKNLENKIREIKECTLTRKAVKNAYDKILMSLKKDNKDECNSEQITYCVSLLSTYFDKLSHYQKIKLYYAIKNYDIGISSAYHCYSDDEIMSLLVCSSIFSEVKEQQGLLDEAVSLAYLCSTGARSLQSQITGGEK